MENVLKTATSMLPMLNREELQQLQSTIADMLRDDVRDARPFRPMSEAELSAELDAALAEFDAGEGYSADVMSQSIRERFGWAKA